MRSGDTSHRPDAGFTILEAALSLVITVLILAVVYSMHQTVLAVRRGTEAREEGPVAVMRLLNGISRDLMCTTPLDEITALEINPSVFSTNASELTLFTAAPDPLGDPDPEWHAIQRIRYRITETDSHNRQLVRETMPYPFMNEGNIQTNILLNHVSVFRVDVLKDGEWASTGQSAKPEEWPQAARILLQREEEELFQTEVFLPAGCVVTSTLSRAVATQ